ncbi:MAG: hypothetical protein AAFR96_08275 [Planctomycetota bacterium]
MDQVVAFLKQNVGWIASFLAIILFLFPIVNWLIDRSVASKLGESTVEDRVSTRLVDKMLETSDIIAKSQAQISQLEITMMALEQESSRAVEIAAKTKDGLNAAQKEERLVRELLLSARTGVQGLVDDISANDDDTLAQARALVSLATEAETEFAGIVTKLEARIHAAELALQEGVPRVWVPLVTPAIVSQPEQGPGIDSIPAAMTLEPSGVLRLRGQVARMYTLETPTDWKLTEYAAQFMNQRDLQYVKDAGDRRMLQTAFYVPHALRPSFGFRTICPMGAWTLGPERFTTLSIDEDYGGYFRDDNGIEYVAALVDVRMGDVVLDDVSWVVRDQEKAREFWENIIVSRETTASDE